MGSVLSSYRKEAELSNCSDNARAEMLAPFPLATTSVVHPSSENKENQSLTLFELSRNDYRFCLHPNVVECRGKTASDTERSCMHV